MAMVLITQGQQFNVLKIFRKTGKKSTQCVQKAQPMCHRFHFGL